MPATASFDSLASDEIAAKDTGDMDGFGAGVADFVAEPERPTTLDRPEPARAAEPAGMTDQPSLDDHKEEPRPTDDSEEDDSGFGAGLL